MTSTSNVVVKIENGKFTIKKMAQLKSNVVYDQTLTEAASTIEVSDLDMYFDGGEYEFILYHGGTTINDVQITFNNLTTNGYFFNAHILHSTATATSGDMTTHAARYIKTTYIGTFTNSSTNIRWPAVMKGKFFFSNLSYKTVAYEIQNSVALDVYHEITNITGVYDAVVDNLTSLEFKKSSGNFLAGTRLIIKKTS